MTTQQKYAVNDNTTQIYIVWSKLQIIRSTIWSKHTILSCNLYGVKLWTRSICKFLNKILAVNDKFNIDCNIALQSIYANTKLATFITFKFQLQSTRFLWQYFISLIYALHYLWRGTSQAKNFIRKFLQLTHTKIYT